MNIGKIFVEGLVREVGRSGGRVISNKVYGNAHSMPIRVVQEIEEGTKPLYSGNRRKFRHSLDRIINSDLPSTKGKAKKQLVELEGALEEYLESEKSAFKMVAWLQASENYVEKVLRIVSDEDVATLAKETKEIIAECRGQVVDSIRSFEYPKKPEGGNGQKLLIIGSIMSAFPIIASIIGNSLSPENSIPDGFGIIYFVVLVTGIIFIATGAKKSKTFQQKTNQYERTTSAIDELNSLADELVGS